MVCFSIDTDDLLFNKVTFLCIDIDDCAAHNCQNGATCVDGIATYTCACATGYTGSYCQTSE